MCGPDKEALLITGQDLSFIPFRQKRSTEGKELDTGQPCGDPSLEGKNRSDIRTHRRHARNIPQTISTSSHSASKHSRPFVITVDLIIIIPFCCKGPFTLCINFCVFVSCSFDFLTQCVSSNNGQPIGPIFKRNADVNAKGPFTLCDCDCVFKMGYMAVNGSVHTVRFSEMSTFPLTPM